MDISPQLEQLKGKLSQSNRILVVTPKDVTIDKLAAALSLYLSLQQAGKQVSIISNGALTVSHTSLFGVGEIKDSFPKAENGDLILSLEGVVDDQGKVSSLEKLDWYPEGNNLNLVFHVLPGQKFEPRNVSTMRSGANFDLIIVVGASLLIEIGDLFVQNTDSFTKAVKVNIDNNPNNNSYGEINLVDPQTPSLSALMNKILTGLQLPQDADISSNILAGIYDQTENLTKNTSAETFIAVGQAMQSGGVVPQQTPNPSPSQQIDVKPFIQPQTPVQQSQPEPVVVPVTPQEPVVQQSAEVVSQPSQPEPAQEPVLQPVEVAPAPVKEEQLAEQPSKETLSEEVPSGEAAVSTGEADPAPDWLTPKVYKGRSLG